MDLDTYLNTKESVVTFAKRICVPPVSLSNWRHKKRPIPIDKAVLIERATFGEVTRIEMRPDDWQKIWPELAKKDKGSEAA